MSTAQLLDNLRLSTGVKLLLSLIVSIGLAFAASFYIPAAKNSSTLATGVVLLLLAIGISLFITIRITYSLHGLLNKANQLAQKGIRYPIDIKERDEFRKLDYLLNLTNTAWQKSMGKQTSELEKAHLHLRKTFNRISQAVTSVLDLDELLALILDIIRTELHLEKVILYLTEDRNIEKMKLKHAIGLREQEEEILAAEGLSLAIKIIQVKEPFAAPSQEIFPIFANAQKGSFTLAAPLLIKDGLAGVIIGERLKEEKTPTEEEINLLATLANQAAIAIDNARLYAQTQVLAITDSLTQLYNRRLFQERLSEEIDRAIRFQHPLSLLMLDIDHFKDYNDTHGHLLGDEILKEIAKILMMVSRSTDVVARYGGEEFTLILPETSKEGAKVTAEKILATIRDHEFPSSKALAYTHVTVSMGLATYPREATEPEDLIKKADEKLYEAKRRGRNQVCS